MKKNSCATVIAIVAGVAAAVGAVITVLYYLNKKGILKLQKTNYEYAEEFPDVPEM